MPSNLQLESRKVCHLTVLNPAIHSRIFYKEALTQAKAGYQVAIIGQDDAREPYTHQGVKIIPIGRFKRQSPQRFKSRKRIAELARAEKADCYQIHTPELLTIGAKIKQERPEVKLIYDMHEDYYLNIRYGGYYPPVLRNFIASWVRSREMKLSNIYDHVIFAEECFELDGLEKGKSTVIRNKFIFPPDNLPSNPLPASGRPVLLYTGTIARTWGVFRAIGVWIRLNKYTPTDLVIAGYTHDDQLLQAIEEMVSENGLTDRFFMIGGKEYVPYDTILSLINQCTAGLGFYRVREHIRDRIPTKFYEFMAMQKPLYFTANPSWNKLNKEYNFGVSINFPVGEEEIKKMAAEIATENIPVQKEIPEEAWSWNTEAAALTSLMENLWA